MKDVTLAGVDGCPAGWCVAWTNAAADNVHISVVPRFSDIVAAHPEPAIVAVDIPIGLPERSGAGGREAENRIRPLLGNRQSSVFSVPSRAAVYADDYGEACRIALSTSDPPRKVSRQLFMLAAKIREVDDALRTRTGIVSRVFEVHPELAFWRLNGECALSEPKKVKGKSYEPGLAQRRELLMNSGFPAHVMHSPPRGAAADDVLDALACAAVARRIHAGVAKPFPDPPPRDAFGLPMAIWG
jgi:predicted RNase H-like nuclease